MILCIDYMYRVKEESVNSLPKIPAQVIGYGEAQILLRYVVNRLIWNRIDLSSRHMTGEPVTSDWRGSLVNTIYYYGGVLQNNKYDRFSMISIQCDHYRTF